MTQLNPGKPFKVLALLDGRVITTDTHKSIQEFTDWLFTGFNKNQLAWKQPGHITVNNAIDETITLLVQQSN